MQIYISILCLSVSHTSSHTCTHTHATTIHNQMGKEREGAIFYTRANQTPILQYPVSDSHQRPWCGLYLLP